MIGAIVSLSVILGVVALVLADKIWWAIVDGIYWLGEKLGKFFDLLFVDVPGKLYKWEQEYKKYGKQGRRHAEKNVNKLVWVGADDSWADTLHDLPKVQVH